MERRAITDEEYRKKRIVHIYYTNLHLNSVDLSGDRYSVVYAYVNTFIGASNSGPSVLCFEKRIGLSDSLNPDVLFHVTLINRVEDETVVEVLMDCLASTDANRTCIYITHR